MSEHHQTTHSLTAIAKIKPGALEPLRQALAGVKNANPSPIEKVATVHFARWVIFDDDTRLLFAVDYDGTWDAYLDDFIDNAPDGLDLVFGCCEGYPAGGSRDREAFKKYVREHQADFQPEDGPPNLDVLTYTAYPNESVSDILKALRIRRNFEAVLEDLQ